jgi:hypothetical protein
MTLLSDPRDPDFLSAVDAVTRKMGKQPLSDEDFILLAGEEISRTVTHEEKEYRTAIKAPPA